MIIRAEANLNIQQSENPKRVLENSSPRATSTATTASRRRRRNRRRRHPPSHCKRSCVSWASFCFSCLRMVGCGRNDRKKSSGDCCCCCSRCRISVTCSEEQTIVWQSSAGGRRKLLKICSQYLSWSILRTVENVVINLYYFFLLYIHLIIFITHTFIIYAKCNMIIF